MSKKARSEGARIAALVRSSGSKYFVADADLEDDENDVFVAADECRKTLGKKSTSSFMIISAGVKQLVVVTNLHETTQEEYSATVWLNSSLCGITTNTCLEDSNAQCAKAVVVADTPFKLKDIVRSNAFKALREANQMEPVEEEEESYFYF